MDFGCGSKPYESLFDVDEYVGVDYENEGHPHINEHIDVFYNGKQLPFDDAHFDSVLCSEVFEHVFNLPDVLQEINRVLKINGTLLITCPFAWNEHEVPFDYARYTQFALQDMLAKHNFEILQFTKAGNFVTTIVQLWILYWSIILQEKCRRFVLLRWGYKSIFVFLPNVFALSLNAVLPVNKTLYLNNVIVARKIK
jgi:SAM-dependent methyltransferase